MVVEDSLEIGEDVRHQLSTAGFHVLALVGTGPEAVRRARLERPDVVVMDLTLEESLDGLDATRRIRLSDGPPVVCLTASTDAATVARACEAGAAGFVVKPFRSDQLVSAVRVALANHQSVTEERHRWRQAAGELRDLSDRLDPVAIVSTELDRLSRRERDVVRLLMAGHRTRVIASHLGISYFTVKNHLKSAFKKFDVSSQAELVALLRPTGAQGDVPPPPPG